MKSEERNVAREHDRIRRLLEDVYVRDMYVGSRQALSREFDDAFVMLVPEIDGRRNVPVALRWDDLEALRSNHPKALDAQTRFEFPLIDIVGNAAVARVDVFRDETPIYSDYVSLYRVDGGWKLVSKVFHSHGHALEGASEDR